MGIIGVRLWTEECHAVFCRWQLLPTSHKMDLRDIIRRSFPSQAAAKNKILGHKQDILEEVFLETISSLFLTYSNKEFQFKSFSSTWQLCVVLGDFNCFFNPISTLAEVFLYFGDDGQQSMNFRGPFGHFPPLKCHSYLNKWRPFLPPSAYIHFTIM